jgi:succinyl-CoA synthetase alpha subunit
MGHSGAWTGRGENDARRKSYLLSDAGAVTVGHPAEFGKVMRELLNDEPPTFLLAKERKLFNSQRRQYHTSRKPHPASHISQQRRSLHLPPRHASDLLIEHGISLTREAGPGENQLVVSVTIDRSGRGPCFLVAPVPYIYDGPPHVTRVPFDIRKGPTDESVDAVLKGLRIDGAAPPTVAAARTLLGTLYTIFTTYEGVVVEVAVAISGATGALLVWAPRFVFDDAAFKSCGRHAALHALRDVSPETVDPAELAAEADGIVYVKLGDRTEVEKFEAHQIGTLVNGAGLAMNTVDALALVAGTKYGREGAANFLDTGGKATAETVKKSFALLLADPRVKVIFVNIFGGLTLGDMIARGILLAFRELGLEERGMPVVVRIRGTNEAEGQRILAESGLKIFAFDDFDEAAAKCVELVHTESEE